MYYVYRLQSVQHPKQTFLGTTRNVKKRLAMHNRQKVEKTAEYAPWRISFYAAFTRKERAESFKEFLTTKKGRSLAHEYFWKASHGGDAPEA